jgi:hypothetical protein
MKKMLLVLCVIAFASLTASATTGYTIAFTGYCDGMSIASYSGIIFGGNHNNANCHGAVIHGGGFRHAAAGYTYYSGAAFDFSDPLLGYTYATNSSLQYLLQVSGTPSHPGPCGWANYKGSDGVGNYLVHSGTCTLVSRPVRAGGTKSSATR